MTYMYIINKNNKKYFRASILHLTKDTDSMYGHAAQIFFFKVKTLLNDAFNIHWASKETYNFLEWCPTKIYGIKMNDFWINVSYSPPHYPRQKTKKSKLPKMR